MSILEGKRINLRALEPEDLDLLYKWENNTAIWWLSNTNRPFSRELLKNYMETVSQDIFEAHQLRFVICANDARNIPIGFIDLFDYDPLHERAGMGILIGDPDNRRKGFGQEAVALICSYAFRVLFLQQLYCSVPENNISSLALFKKAGFTETGIRKNWLQSEQGWLSEHFLQLLRSDWAKSSS